MIIYICVYGEFNPDQPRISRIKNSLVDKGYDVLWVVSETKLDHKDVISMDCSTKLSYLRKAVVFLRKKLDDDDIIIGYIHIGAAVALLSTRGKKSKYVYDYPDPWMGWYFYDSPEDTIKWRLGRFAFHWIEKILYKKADYVYTASQTQLEFLQKEHGIRDNSEVVYNCPDFELFSKCSGMTKTMEKLKDRQVLVFLGKICSEYGVDTLIDAFRIIHKSKPKTHLVLLGSATDEFTKFLNKKIKEYKLKQHVTIHPYVMHTDVPKVISHSLIGFVPYKDRLYNNLGGPNKLFEYMAGGAVPVVSDMMEFRKHMKDNVNGIFVEPENPKKLAEATIRLLDNAKLMQKMRANNLKKSRDIYNWNIQMGKVFNIIDSLEN